MFYRIPEVVFVTAIIKGEDLTLSRCADFGSAKEAMSWLQELARYNDDLEFEISIRGEYHAE